jgi:hypothetical protein
MNRNLDAELKVRKDELEAAISMVRLAESDPESTPDRIAIVKRWEIEYRRKLDNLLKEIRNYKRIDELYGNKNRGKK